MNWRKRYFDDFSCYRTRYTFIWRAGEHSYHKLQVIFQQCETMGSCLLNFLLVRVKLLIWWDFCRFLKVLLEQLLKFLLISELVLKRIFRNICFYPPPFCGFWTAAYWSKLSDKPMKFQNLANTKVREFGQKMKESDLFHPWSRILENGPDRTEPCEPAFRYKSTLHKQSSVLVRSSVPMRHTRSTREEDHQYPWSILAVPMRHTRSTVKKIISTCEAYSQCPWGIHPVPVRHTRSTYKVYPSSREAYPQYPWGTLAAPVRKIISTCEAYPQYSWGRSSVPVRHTRSTCKGTREAYSQYL